VPSYLLPGPYALTAVVYDTANKSACRPVKEGKALTTESIAVGRVEVRDVPPVAREGDRPPDYGADFEAGALRLVGFNAAGGPHRAGDRATVTLFWQLGEDEVPTDDPSLRLISESGEMVADVPVGLMPALSRGGPRGERTYGTYVDVALPGRLNGGTYRLVVAVKDGRGSELVFEDLPTLQVTARERTFLVPPVPHRRAATFGGAIDLIGFDLEPDSVRVGANAQTLRLTLYWQCRREMERSYKAFVHLVGPDGKIHGQSDRIPLGDLAPTTGWSKGEVLVDAHDIPIGAGAPPGEYRLLVGFYDPQDGSRLPLEGGSADSADVAAVSFTHE
jgi:hypothetical protein